eukprot:gene3091-3867_t
MSSEIIYKKISQLDGAFLYFYGIVHYIGQIKPSKTSSTSGSNREKSITIKVADGADPQDSFQVTLYYERDTFIDQIRIGSVTRFHRLKKSIKINKSGIGDIDHSRCNFSMLIFNSFQTPLKPSVSSTVNYSLDKSDIDIVSNLKTLWDDISTILAPTSIPNYSSSVVVSNVNHGPQVYGNNRNTGTVTTTTTTTNTMMALTTTNITEIGELVEHTMVNVVAKILDTQFPSGSLRRAKIKLWDGTGEYWEDGEKHVGKVIDANTWNLDQIAQIESIKIGSWVKISSIKVLTFKDVLELKLQTYSIITLLPDDDPLVLQLTFNDKIEPHQEIQHQIQQPPPPSSLSQYINNNNHSQIKITNTFYPHIPITMIKDIKTFQDSTGELPIIFTDIHTVCKNIYQY